MKGIAKFIRERSLVAIRRSSIDAHGIQGIPLGASPSLLLLQYAYDFTLDGLMVLRTADISDLQRSKTDAFQQRMLEEEGMLHKLPSVKDVDLSGWHGALKTLSTIYPLQILECELRKEPQFSIGRIVDVRKSEVEMKYFTGIARWLKEPVTLRFRDISCCQVNTRYINAYQRYFDRHAL